MKKQAVELKFYESIDVLPLYNWDKFTNTKDNNWFIVGYDNRQTKIESEQLKVIEAKIMDEYFHAVNDASFKAKLQKWADIEYLKLKYKTVTVLVDRCWAGFPIEQEETRHAFFMALKSWGFKIDYMQSQSDDEKALSRIRNSLEGIDTQINILLNELKEENKGQKTELIKQLRVATLALGYAQRLKISDLTLAEWIDICHAMEELSKKN